MSDSGGNTRTVAISGEVLTLVFVVLKLTHVIDWSWWWVLAPTWIPMTLGLLLVVVILVLKRKG
jgi:hypothetical protein